MNTAAVNAWEQKTSLTHKNISNKTRRQRQRQRRRRLSVNRDCTTSDTAVDLQKPQPERISQIPPHKPSSNISLSQNKSISEVAGQNSPHSSLNHPHIIVQVSQHSSFDKDLYIAYQSSLSTQGSSSLLPPHPASRLERSSSLLSIHLSAAGNDIIPDSQSLPGSCSYQSRSSTSLAVLGADQTPLNPKSRVLHNSTDLESPTGGVAEATESLEDSSAVVIEASQPSIIVSERSRSEPVPSTTETFSTSSGAQLRSLARSTSDPTCTHHDPHQCRAFISEVSSNQSIIQDQVIQGPVDYQSHHQTPAEYPHQRQGSSEVQVPGSADRSSRQSHTVGDNPADSLVFQTQVPLAFASQGSRISITPAGTSSSEPTFLLHSHVRHYLIKQGMQTISCRTYSQSHNLSERSLKHRQGVRDNHRAETTRIQASPRLSLKLTRARAGIILHPRKYLPFQKTRLTIATLHKRQQQTTRS